MTKIMTSLLAGTAFLGLVSAAQAADMGSPLRGPTVVASDPAPVTSGGWYLRGDVGVSIAGKPKLESEEPGTPKGFITQDRTDAPKIALGVGYQFNEYLRGDITGEYIASSRVRGIASYNSVYGGTPSTNFVNYDGHLRTFVLMANVYGDLGNFNGLTPYVGVGAGAAYHETSDIWNEVSFYNQATGAPLGPAEHGYQPGKGKWSFAWALHTGMTWDISPNAKFDFGYSFKNLGQATSSSQHCYTGTGCTDTLKIKDIVSHDIHAGIRWTLDPVQKAPVYASAPVVAKY